MKKRLFGGGVLVVFLIMAAASAHTLSEKGDSRDTACTEDAAQEKEISESTAVEESNSQKWNSTVCQDIITQYSKEYHLEFDIATKDIEDKVYGVWQGKDIVGWDRLDGCHGLGVGDIYIFSQAGWIEGNLMFQPVYYYYTARIEELSSGDILNAVWADKNYEKQEAVFIIGVDIRGAEKRTPVDKEYSHAVKILLVGDKLVLQNYYGDFIEMEKVADVEIPEGRLDIN